MDEAEVKRAMSLPESDRMRAFDDIKKMGIYRCNMQKINDGDNNLIRERQQGEDDLQFCSTCKGFFAKTYFYKHRLSCMEHSKTIPTPNPVSLFYSDYNPLPNEFKIEVVSHLADDALGNLAKTDKTILYMGLREFNRTKSRKEKKVNCLKHVRGNMRSLAELYTAFLQEDVVEQLHEDASDMFNRVNFSALSEAVTKICVTVVEKDGKQEELLKHGKKINLLNLLKSSSKLLKAKFLQERRDGEADEVEKFLTILNDNAPILFNDAFRAANINQQENLRLPKRTPMNQDVERHRNGCIRIMDDMTKDPYKIITSHEYVTLRDAACSRLTLFNARRGGEPARLTLKEYHNGLSNVWMNNHDNEGAELKVTYQPGKGAKHLVPVLFPEDTLSALQVLADPAVRSACGIREDNKYLFPATQLSESHVDGWTAINNISKAVGVVHIKTMTATCMRHRISTLYAYEDASPEERRLFYKHMGHSEAINENVYQAPLAHAEVEVIGRRLQRLDEGKQCNLLFLPQAPYQIIFICLVKKNQTYYVMLYPSVPQQ